MKFQVISGKHVDIFAEGIIIYLKWRVSGFVID